MSNSLKHWIEDLKNEVKWLKADGLPNIARSKAAFAQIAWLVIMLVSTAICTFLVIGSIHEYAAYEVITTNRLLQEQQSVLPTITICMTNPFTTDYSVSLMQNAKISSSSVAGYRDVMIALENYSLNTTGSYMSNDQKSQLTDLNRMILDCAFNSLTCNASDFQWVWSSWSYGCYRFNAGYDSANNPVELKTTSTSGYAYSFQLSLYIGLPNYWSSFIGQYAPRGINVYIHNASDYPFGSTPAPYLITPGFGAHITVSRSFNSQYNAWPYAYSECRVDEDNELIGPPLSDPYLFEQVKATNYTYTQDTCILFCQQLMTTRACQCNNYFIPFRVEPYDYCMSKVNRSCASAFISNIFLVGDFIQQNCIDKCPLECYQRTLSASVDYAVYPTPSIAQGLLLGAYKPKMRVMHANESDFTSGVLLYNYNLVSFSVFYNQLSYMTSEEKAAVTLETLIGALGGHFHLFLGMSLLSMIEIVELCVLGVGMHIEYKKRKKIVQQVVEQLTVQQNDTVSSVSIEPIKKSQATIGDTHESISLEANDTIQDESTNQQ